MLSTRTERKPSRQPRSSLWMRDTFPDTDARRTGFECAMLTALMTLVGWFVVPSHWTSIWMDREFTGWVAPVANRLGEIRLYADGGHVPMPPLPFVFMRLITGGHATWLCESSANFAFQALTLLAMYASLRSLFRAPVPFLATAAAIPVFFSLPKTIVYDSMAQFFAALVCLGALGHARNIALRPLACEAGVHSRWSDWLSPSLLLMALASALCLLSKQSTGGGACLGAVVALCLASAEPLRRRLGDVAIFGIWTALLFALMTLALLPWIDVVGMARDVFLTGSEPKGGSLRMLKNLGIFSLDIGQQALLMAFTVIAGLGALTRNRVIRPVHDDEEKTFELPTIVLWLPAIAALLAVLICSTESHMERLFTGCATIARQILWSGLLLGFVGFRLRALGYRPEKTGHDGLADSRPMLAVLLGAALFHSLSTPRFRWTYDNNPLIVLAFALFLSASLEFVGRWKLAGRRPIFAGLGFVSLVVGVAWMQLGPQLAACQACTQRWADVPYLDGARLPATADGMHATVFLVRELAAEDETVLLLPNDPNVEAWFDRPRPRLSAAIVFADQYWDRLVEGDLAALRAQLPKVVVIGPRHFWHDFQCMWQPNYGAARLTDALLRDVLPAHYHLQQSVPIVHRGAADFMDVYVRNR